MPSLEAFLKRYMQASAPHVQRHGGEPAQHRMWRVGASPLRLPLPLE
jgi:hypothetical protein